MIKITIKLETEESVERVISCIAYESQFWLKDKSRVKEILVEGDKTFIMENGKIKEVK